MGLYSVVPTVCHWKEEQADLTSISLRFPSLARGNLFLILCAGIPGAEKRSDLIQEIHWNLRAYYTVFDYFDVAKILVGVDRLSKSPRVSFVAGNHRCREGPVPLDSCRTVRLSGP